MKSFKDHIKGQATRLHNSRQQLYDWSNTDNDHAIPMLYQFEYHYLLKFSSVAARSAFLKVYTTHYLNRGDECNFDRNWKQIFKRLLTYVEGHAIESVQAVDMVHRALESVAIQPNQIARIEALYNNKINADDKLEDLIIDHEECLWP